MSAKIIDCSDSKKEEERIKYLEDWVEMQFWLYEQQLMDECELMQSENKSNHNEDYDHDA